MTFDELVHMPKDAPIRLADGAYGLMIRLSKTHSEIGVQVFGESDIRWIPFACVAPLPGGALVEWPDCGKKQP